MKSFLICLAFALGACGGDDPPADLCGDGNVDTGEECDDGNTVSGDGCSATCQTETPDPECGDGTVDAGEECDDGNTADGDGCSASCTIEAVCGDGTVAGDEACDDGNTTSGDGCSADCTSDETCGNGVLDAKANGEVCDDGNTTGGDGCSADCSSDESCGNNIVDPGEVCDDGNEFGGDGCSIDCLSDETCGNGVTDAATGEVCDDGNNLDADGCSATCASDETCGNGINDFTVGEVCDDGNTTGGDGCSADCSSDESCGNGVMDPGEVCDDGNTTAGDMCSPDCLSNEACGNGYVDAAIGEACDDGNTVGGDGCSADCTSDESCGNGIVELLEACDDGNTATGDGCSDTCTLEPGWETEDNNSLALADDWATHNLMDRVNANLNPGGDHDWFMITAPSGGATTYNLSTRSYGPGGAGSCTDTYFHLRDPMGTQLAANDDTFGLCSQINWNGVAPGATLYLDIRHYNATTGTGGYQVEVLWTGVVCGDGVVAAPETCDDGNLVDGDGCDSNCRITACGNGVVTSGETCDDGNTTSGDGCDSNCTPTGCGNSIITMGEECDDGNVLPLDGCSATCTLESSCGNGVVQPALGETCDDGNLIDGDCCSSTCTAEPGCEVEPNNVVGTPTDYSLANDWSAVSFNNFVEARINPANDQDWFEFVIPGPSDAYIYIENFDGSFANCTSSTSDQYLHLYGSTGTQLTTNDDGGPGLCSIIKGQYAPGTYYIRARAFSSTATYPYFLSFIQYPLVCGDGVQSPLETCDDGNNIDGDGCSAVCVNDSAASYAAESEPNDDGTPSTASDFLAAAADGPYSADTIVVGSIGVLGDDDSYAVTNAGLDPVRVRFETFTTAVGTCDVGVTTGLRLKTATGTIQYSDTTSGINSCSLTDYMLFPGETIYAEVYEVGENATIATYHLAISFL